MKKELIALMPDLIGGGAERVMSLILRKAVENGYRTVLLLSNAVVHIDYELDERIEIIRIPKQEGGKISRKLNLIRYLRSYTRKHRDAVYLSFLPERNVDLLFSAPKKVKVVVSVRNDPAKDYEGSKPWLMIRDKMYKRARTVVFQTPDAKEYFSKRGVGGVIIPNPVSPGLPYHNKNTDSKVIVCVARLVTQKNYPMLMDAFCEVWRSHPDYQLHIWGKEGHEIGVAEQLQKYADSLSCADAIKFKGFGKDVAQRIAEAEMFVLSSDYEGMSNAMLEALAIGTPCVCTDCPVGAARMFIKDGENGLLTPVGDSSAMAAAINRMIEDNELKERCFANADTLRAELDENNIFKKWMLVLDEKPE